MRKLWKWIRSDGLLHIESCALLIIAFAAFIPLVWAAGATVVVGICKELWDRKHGGVASWHDVICDLCGVALGVLLVLIFYR